MLLAELILSPSKGTLHILQRKVFEKEIKDLIETTKIEAVGILQGQMAQIILASDIACKSANVQVSEISGSCLQHNSIIAIFGSTSAVKTALTAVNDKLTCKSALQSEGGCF